MYAIDDLEMRITGALRKKIFWEQGKWHHIPGAQDSGKHFLPPKITENQRREVIEKLWREARNEMWLVRHKYEVSVWLFIMEITLDIRKRLKVHQIERRYEWSRRQRMTSTMQRKCAMIWHYCRMSRMKIDMGLNIGMGQL